jgi:hypothetical protein
MIVVRAPSRMTELKRNLQTTFGSKSSDGRGIDMAVVSSRGYLRSSLTAARIAEAPLTGD